MSLTGGSTLTPAPTKGGGSTSPGGAGRRWLAVAYLGTPMLVLLVLFVVPMVILFLISIGLGAPTRRTSGPSTTTPRCSATRSTGTSP